MSKDAKNTTAPLMPAVRYRDCNKAVDFLTRIFGFTEGAAFRDDKGACSTPSSGSAMAAS